MKPKARMVIPFWGVAYTHKVINLTLPALLSPNNLPALCESFDIELCLVTETKMFDVLRQSKPYITCTSLCEVILEPIDDLLTGIAGDYGPVLTFALFKGFVGLKERMLDYYLLFLCADFIVADGSYRTVARLMEEGKQVIHSPSFRAIEEEALPVIQSKIDRETGVLAMPHREMVDLALRHRHMTVSARTVNQKTSHQWRMDQFYWYVDEHTLIGYQWPVALMALKPQVVVETPVLMFDYGFIPEICPTAEYYFIPDSDQCFMLEMESRFASESLMRLGWISDEAIIKDLNLWTTLEHRICGQQPHIFHSRDVPSGTDALIAESRIYMQSLVGRLAPPNPHRDHPLFCQWWNEAVERMPISTHHKPRPPVETQPAVVAETVPSVPRRSPFSSLCSSLAGVIKSSARAVRAVVRARPSKRFLNALGPIYQFLVGRLPRVRMSNVYWQDTRKVVEILDNIPQGASVIYIGDGESMFAPLLPKHIETEAIRNDLINQIGSIPEKSVDLCFCDLSLDEARSFIAVYNRIRPLIADGGRILLYVYNADHQMLSEQDVNFINGALPNVDLSTARFFGTRETRKLRTLVQRVCLARMFQYPLLRLILSGGLIVVLSPLVWMANRRAMAVDQTIYTPSWTSMLLEFQIQRSA